MGINDSKHDDSMVICDEQNPDCWGIKPPDFDSEAAKSNVRLNNILGCSDGQEVERKISEANKKMKTLDVNHWLGPFTLLSVVGFSVSLFVFSFIAAMKHKNGDILQLSEDPVSIVGLIIISIFFILIMVTLTLMAKRSNTRNTEVIRILKDHFSDWNEKGIEVEYHPMDEYESKGYLKLILKPSYVISPYNNTQNFTNFENFEST